MDKILAEDKWGVYGTVYMGNSRRTGSETCAESAYIRKRRLISQEKLASLSGVSYGSIKRFEATGQISLISLTKIAMALDIADELRNIFTQVPYRDIQEVINERR